MTVECSPNNQDKHAAGVLNNSSFLNASLLKSLRLVAN
jgi:hypothetical protein